MTEFRREGLELEAELGEMLGEAVCVVRGFLRLERNGEQLAGGLGHGFGGAADLDDMDELHEVEIVVARGVVGSEQGFKVGAPDSFHLSLDRPAAGTAFAAPADCFLHKIGRETSAVGERGHAHDHCVQAAEVAGPGIVGRMCEGENARAGFLVEGDVLAGFQKGTVPAKSWRAMACTCEGTMLVYRGFQILPLVAPGAVVGEVGEIPGRAHHFIRRGLGPDLDPRVKVELPDFPNTATGFAIFRNGELLDLCLTGVPVGRVGLFDNLALYAEGTANAGCLDEATAFVRVTTFLDNLPIRGQDDDTHEIRYWLEHGIHDGTCVLDDQDRLVSLRIVMKSARDAWYD